jgi:hypothetical protein
MWFRKARGISLGERTRCITEANQQMKVPHKGELLDRCQSNAERRKLCLEWAEQARNAWFNGNRESVINVLISKSPRYRDYPAAVRKSIGERQWGNSIQAKQLADAEQMYSRWAQHYAEG